MRRFLSKQSRYAGTPLYRLTDTFGNRINSASFGVWRRINIPNRADDFIHVVEDHEIGRMDLIAHKYYSSSLLWWVIADKNAIFDPFSDMFVGQELRISPHSVVISAIEEAGASRR